MTFDKLIEIISYEKESWYKLWFRRYSALFRPVFFREEDEPHSLKSNHFQKINLKKLH